MGMCKGCSEVYSTLDMKDGFCEECGKKFNKTLNLRDKKDFKDEPKFSFPYGESKIKSFFIILFFSILGYSFIFLDSTGSRSAFAGMLNIPFIIPIVSLLFLWIIIVNLIYFISERKYIIINNGTISIPSDSPSKLLSDDNSSITIDIDSIYKIIIHNVNKEEEKMSLSTKFRYLDIEKKYLDNDYEKLKKILKNDYKRTIKYL